MQKEAEIMLERQTVNAGPIGDAHNVISNSKLTPIITHVTSINNITSYNMDRHWLRLDRPHLILISMIETI